MKGYRMYQTRPEGGDCTAPYDIDFFESYTVKEFVNDILVMSPWNMPNSTIL